MIIASHSTDFLRSLSTTFPQQNKGGIQRYQKGKMWISIQAPSLVSFTFGPSFHGGKYFEVFPDLVKCDVN